MWRVFVFGCISLCVAVKVAASTIRTLQPWKAAEAVLRTLPDSYRLQRVDDDTIEIFCGQQLQLGLQIDDRLYQAHVENEDNWQRLEHPRLMNTASPVNEAMTESHVLLPPCLLPEVTLSGPLEIEWALPTQTKLHVPPESEKINEIVHIILEEGAHVKLHGMTTLELKDSMVLHGASSDYWDLIDDGREDEDPEMMGLMHMSAALQRDALESGIPLGLRARASPQGITVSQLPHHPVYVAQTAPDTLRIHPQKVSSLGLSRVASPTCWPFSQTAASDVLPYERLLRQILRHHQPEIDPERTSLILSTAVSRMVLLLHLQMEVQTEMKPVEILDAHVLVYDDDEYLPIHTHPVKSYQKYTATISLSDFMNDTADPDLLLYDIYL